MYVADYITFEYIRQLAFHAGCDQFLYMLAELLVLVMPATGISP